MVRRNTRRGRWASRGGYLLLALGLGALPLGSCGDESGEGSPGEEAAGQEGEPANLGPVDGWDLPATDLDRVAVGSSAPDFSLRTLGGDTVTLSSFRGIKNVVLVFYRGHW